MQDSYLEHKITARSISDGDLLGTFDRRKTTPTFRRVDRTSDNNNGTVSIFLAGQVMPEVLPCGASVVVRVRRKR
jgi:hypothetical protein